MSSHTRTLPDFQGEPIAVGDRVLPIGWGNGIPLWLSNTAGTVVGIGRTRIRVRFDCVTYREDDRGEAAPSGHFRRLGS
jgi:hypothetical protein